MTPERDIRDLTIGELRKELSGWGEPAYRAGQMYDWLYRKGADSFDDLTDIPKVLRQRLAESFSLGALELAEHLVSRDRS
jgi:23S rRNA (adenine2503-C2)-methyltransferase